MEPITAYDVHADLRAQVYACKKKLNELETQVYTLMDAFLAHTHEDHEGTGIPWDKEPEP